MAKEVLLYGQIFNFTVEEVISKLEEAKDEDEIVLRINTMGGSVFAGWGLMAKIQELGSKLKIKVDGAAMSMGAAILALSDNVTALNVSEIMIHRAGYSPGFERDYMSEEERETLKATNKNLREALEQKVNESRLKELKGVTFDDIFSMETRVDVYLTAKEAQEIGLVNNVVQLSREEALAMLTKEPKEEKASKEEPKNSNQSKSNNMTPEQFKTQHPEAYKALVEEVKAEEADRVSAWLVFSEVDPKAVKQGIESGKNISQKATAEFIKSEFIKAEAGNLEEDSAEDLTTEAPSEATAEDKKLEAFVAELEQIKKS